MAKLRIPRKPKSFTYGEGDEAITLFIRKPTTFEQSELTTISGEYQRSIRKEIVSDKADDILDENLRLGDISLFVKMKEYIAIHLVVDDEDANVFNNKVEPNADEWSIKSVPNDLIDAVWICYAELADKKQYLGVDLVDVFGNEFVRTHAVVGSNDVDQELRRLDLADKAAAHKARIALDIKDKGPLVSASPTTEATTI